MPVWVITGANRGLGLEFAAQLSTDSSNIIFTTVRSLSRDLTALDSLKSKAENLHILECDTGSQNSIASFAAQLSSFLGPERKIDFLLNNAGINLKQEQTALNITPEVLSEHMSVNVMGPATIVQVLEKHLQHGSLIMNMTSGLGSMAQNRAMEIVGCTAYSISKAAVNMLTVRQATELKEKGVIVVCMDPGWVKTDMGGNNADLEKEESIGGMLRCLKGLRLIDSGKFFCYDGSEKAW